MTVVRSQLSRKNPYWISPYEFRTAYYFALQYREWKQEYEILASKGPGAVTYGESVNGDPRESSTERNGMKLAELSTKINMIEQALHDAADDIYDYMLIGVTEEGTSFNYLRNKYDIPCGKNYYYKSRRRFYWILSKRLSASIV